ncbi:hypothetical protein HYV49_04530 [Candidatus Pacearchaeota archaeon]|nr:hypothetical protein [Candidatus Pacearchaeota archaeon]
MKEKNDKMTGKKIEEEKVKNAEEEKIIAFFSVFLLIIGFFIALIFRKDNKYIMYYAKHGLIIFFAMILIKLLEYVVLVIPVLGKIIAGFAWFIIIILWILGSIYALSGAQKRVPLISEIAEKIKI